MRAVTAAACRGRRPSSRRSRFPAAKAPHFSRLGDVEVNAGQNASFQCMAAGRAAEAERFLLQVRRTGAVAKVCWGLLLGPGSALLSWTPPSSQDRERLQDSPTTLSIKDQRPPFVNQLCTFQWRSPFQEPRVPSVE